MLGAPKPFPTGQKTHSIFCIKVCKYLTDAILWKRLLKWRTSYILHNDSPSCHTSLTMHQLLLKYQIPPITPQQFSPNLALWHFLLFARLTHSSSFCIHRRNSTQCNITYHGPTKTSRSAATTGSTAGARAYTQKARTSNVSRLGFIHILFTTNYAFIPGTLGSFHVY